MLQHCANHSAIIAIIQFSAISLSSQVLSTQFALIAIIAIDSISVTILLLAVLCYYAINAIMLFCVHELFATINDTVLIMLFLMILYLGIVIYYYTINSIH